tara:strand:- start:214 stop:849 length:636 start_codon:yes stop_codon:yes gene_type:complete
MLKYTKDQNKENILLDSNNEQVMMEWEKPYMEACINMLKPKGDVLEIGFGMGYSATAIQKYNPKSHTIIECDPIVISKCKKWSKKYNNVNIIEAKWQDVICTDQLKTYNEVFFDDFPNNITNLTELEKIQTITRIYLFIDFIHQYHLKKNSKISAYLCENESMSNHPIWKSKFIDNPNWEYTEKFINIKISNIQKYHKSNNKAIIPLLKLV